MTSKASLTIIISYISSFHVLSISFPHSQENSDEDDDSDDMTTTDDNDDGQDQNLTSNPSEDTRVDMPEDHNAPRQNESHPSQSQLQGIA